MVVSIFRSRLKPEHAAEFQTLADQLMKTAEIMPGFISYKLFTAGDGERCSLVEFETNEQLEAWRNLPVHREAQEFGRARFYESYSLEIGEPLREAHFPAATAER